MGIENEDTTLRIPQKTGNKAIDEVFNGMDRLNTLFQKTKIEIGAQEQYFKSIINQSGTGLFSVNEKGRVININPSAEKLTNLINYHHVSSLARINPDLPDFIMKKNTEDKGFSAIYENTHGQKLLFKLTQIKAHSQLMRLVAVSDITKELDSSEVDAWIKLARTLAHEIMNNIAPITTLSKVISDYYKIDTQIIEKEKLDQAVINNTVKGLEVIEERSTGLLKFVENYRKFTKLPEPEIKRCHISEVVEKALVVCSAFHGYSSIHLETKIEQAIYAQTDGNLVSQVLINLLKNAMEALLEDRSEKNPKIKIQLLNASDSIFLTISNNGAPILPELREQIFVPFFTTKENGSGIGLSLSKQIMLKLGGDIGLLQKTDGWTHFQIKLPLS
jgi:nitrogen fixation/metabolism regulation signal transduction histidine kinase